MTSWNRQGILSIAAWKNPQVAEFLMLRRHFLFCNGVKRSTLDDTGFEKRPYFFDYFEVGWIRRPFLCYAYWRFGRPLGHVRRSFTEMWFQKYIGWRRKLKPFLHNATVCAEIFILTKVIIGLIVVPLSSCPCIFPLCLHFFLLCGSFSAEPGSIPFSVSECNPSPYSSHTPVHTLTSCVYPH